MACGSERKSQAKESNSFFQGQSLFEHLRQLIDHTNRRVLVLWALELAEETAAQLEAKYPDHRPREAVETARAWAKGEIKMPIAKRAILNCHAMAKELTDPADIARCHAVGQACSVVHTVSHALGYPMYELTALVLERSLEECRDIVEQRALYYEQRLRYWTEYEKTCQRNWADFLKK